MGVERVKDAEARNKRKCKIFGGKKGKLPSRLGKKVRILTQNRQHFPAALRPTAPVPGGRAGQSKAWRCLEPPRKLEQQQSARTAAATSCLLLSIFSCFGLGQSVEEAACEPG